MLIPRPGVSAWSGAARQSRNVRTTRGRFMKLLSKTAWRNFAKAVARACPRLSRRHAGFALENMEPRNLLSAAGLDPGFGTNGVATVDFGGNDSGMATVL